MFILVEFRKYAEGKPPSGVATFLVWAFAIICSHCCYSTARM
jgi:hypothetical protein